MNEFASFIGNLMSIISEAMLQPPYIYIIMLFIFGGILTYIFKLGRG